MNPNDPQLPHERSNARARRVVVVLAATLAGMVALISGVAVIATLTPEPLTPEPLTEPAPSVFTWQDEADRLCVHARETRRRLAVDRTQVGIAAWAQADAEILMTLSQDLMALSQDVKEFENVDRDPLSALGARIAAPATRLRTLRAETVTQRQLTSIRKQLVRASMIARRIDLRECASMLEEPL